MAANTKRVSFLCLCIAFSLHSLCMVGAGGFRLQTLNLGKGELKDKDRTVQASLIIAFLAYFVSLALCLLPNFAEVKGRLVHFVGAVLAGAGALFTLVGIGVFVDELPSDSVSTHAYVITAYIVAVICAGLAAVSSIIQGIGKNA